MKKTKTKTKKKNARGLNAKPKKLDMRSFRLKPAKKPKGIPRSPKLEPASNAANAPTVLWSDPRASAAVAAARAWEGKQALIPGELPRAQLVSPHPDDEQRTVMTLRTDRGHVRVWKVAARIEGETFPMNWALKVLDAAAAKLIRESGGVVRT